jgi:hypothetical protein
MTTVLHNHVRTHRVAIILLMLLSITGCGYSQMGADPPANPAAKPGGYAWHALYREDIHSVTIPTFTNITYRRGLEVTLAKALAQDIEAHTPYKVVSPQSADTILQGEIIYAGNTPLSINPFTTLPQEQQFNITVNFTWKDLRTGQLLVERKSFQQKASYYPTLGESPSVGSTDAVEQLALGIVQELQADW